MCKNWCEAIIAVLVIIFSLVPNMPQNWANWAVLVLGILLLIHSFSPCKCHDGDMKVSSKKRR